MSRLVALWTLLGAWTPAWAGTLEVHILDVGQGDAILIESPAGKTVLIDAGQGETPVAPLLAAHDVTALDLVVATHPHADHVGGMQAVVESVPIKLYTDNGLPHTTQTYAKLMAAVEARGLAYRAAEHGQVYNLDDGAKLEILFPTGAPLTGTRSDLNSNSVVMRLTHQGHCMLLVGDSEEPTENALISGGLGACEVLKVAHHGSNHSTTTRWLDTVKPRVALISVGEHNRYNHPGHETLARLQAAGVEVHRTDLEGTITVRSSEAGLEIVGERSAVAGASAPAAPAPHADHGDAPPNVDQHTDGHADLQLAAPEDLPGAACPFPSSGRSEVFHEAGCGNASKINPGNLVCYTTKAEAEAGGKRPAGCCKP